MIFSSSEKTNGLQRDVPPLWSSVVTEAHSWAQKTSRPNKSPLSQDEGKFRNPETSVGRWESFFIPECPHAHPPPNTQTIFLKKLRELKTGFTGDTSPRARLTSCWCPFCVYAYRQHCMNETNCKYMGKVELYMAQCRAVFTYKVVCKVVRSWESWDNVFCVFSEVLHQTHFWSLSSWLTCLCDEVNA